MKRRLAFALLALGWTVGVGLLSRAWTLRSQSADLAQAQREVEALRWQLNVAIGVAQREADAARAATAAATAASAAASERLVKAQARSRAVASAPVPVTPGELREAAEGLGFTRGGR